MRHNRYFDDRVQSLGFSDAEGDATVGVIDPGEYAFGTSQRERMTVVAGISNSEPSLGTGRRRPDSSGSPSSMRMHFMRTMRLPSLTKPMGAARYSRTMPSACASSISSAIAGISLMVRR